jgi:hypothetical protein
MVKFNPSFRPKIFNNYQEALIDFTKLVNQHQIYHNSNNIEHSHVNKTTTLINTILILSARN